MTMPTHSALAQAFAILAAEQPAYYARFAASLRGLVIHCTVDEERFVITGGDHPHVSTGGHADAAIIASARRDAVLALIDGDISILQAVMARRLFVKADIALMVPLSRAQRAFAEGAVRARGMRPLLKQWRGDL